MDLMYVRVPQTAMVFPAAPRLDRSHTFRATAVWCVTTPVVCMHDACSLMERRGHVAATQAENWRRKDGRKV